MSSHYELWLSSSQYQRRSAEVKNAHYEYLMKFSEKNKTLMSYQLRALEKENLATKNSSEGKNT